METAYDNSGSWIFYGFFLLMFIAVFAYGFVDVLWHERNDRRRKRKGWQ